MRRFIKQAPVRTSLLGKCTPSALTDAPAAKVSRTVRVKMMMKEDRPTLNHNAWLNHINTTETRVSGQALQARIEALEARVQALEACS